MTRIYMKNNNATVFLALLATILGPLSSIYSARSLTSDLLCHHV